MRPSTVQTSRFSFFSREVIFAFAPCSTASTCAIESFQRKPNGGKSSSTEYACAAERKRAMTPVETIRRTALLSQLKVQFASRFSIFVCVARIFDLASSGTLEAGKLRARVNAVKSVAKSATKFFSRTRALLFLVKKIFGRKENK